MRNRRLSWLTLGLTGLLLGAPSCKDEPVGDDTTTAAVPECSACSSSGQCRGECIQLSGVQGKIGVCAESGATSCCDLSNPTDCKYNLTGIPVEEFGSGGSSGSGGSASGGKGGSGGSLLGGSGGSAGKGGSGGSAGTVNPNTTQLGAACESDADCDDDRMFCLLSDGLEDGSGPPGGLCTLPCTSDGNCFEITDNVFCVEFSDTEAYCLESCTTGQAGEPKCQNRDDFACSIVGLIPGDDECETSDDCTGGQLCSTSGVCGDIVTGCLPTCGGDYDCDSGSCDFRTGFCNDDKPDDLLPIGAPCVPPGDNDPEPCDGFCVPTNDAGTQGECEAFCVSTDTFIGCGFDGSEPAEAACLYGTILSPPGDVGFGDVMICGKMCDCNDECPISGDRCVDESGGYVLEIWGRNGYCRQLADDESESDTFSECPPGSTGGTGGTGNNTAGEPGSSGEGGAGADASGGTGGSSGGTGGTSGGTGGTDQGGQGGT